MEADGEEEAAAGTTVLAAMVGTTATRTTEAAWWAARTPVPTGPKSKCLVSGHDIELWCGERFVIKLSYEPE
jgi:hypothetical protein